ncbi:hypothetical protein PLICRDRAFT_169961 [Plicaturopsis crispa FD-325 SS-3]|nr:hypothetical protein PLICRDRAFT_169961 [Plicaturopsis crispa FD-325 SS-3]
MPSPPSDLTLSTSPTSIGRTSPVHRRSSASPSEFNDATLRPRLSPTIGRSFDLNDPEVRERQRTLDADMAMQLSRARRDTVTNATAASPYDQVHPPHHSDSSFPSMSHSAQHEMDMAKGDAPHPADSDNGDAPDDATLLLHEEVSPHIHHLHQMHDPSLLVSSGPSRGPDDIDDPAPSMFGLPTYQPNVSRTNFDFSLMEDFAVEEKAVLGITSPPIESSGIAFKLRKARQASGTAQNDAETSSNAPRRVRERKLSQSNPNPRQRKGIGGKMALFEGNQGDPPSSLAGRLGLGASAEPPTNNTSYFPSTNAPPSAPGPEGTPSMGILNTGHDRPYRFSFYSNALSATIHARSLSELPAEGQTFEQLFSGVTSPSRPGTRSPHAAGGGGRNGAEGASALSAHGTGFSTNSNKYPADQKNGMGSAMVGGGGDFEGSTWWLDIQSPTDEEMKMLSKVFSIHPLTTEDIQMEETREKIELFRNYYLVCFRSFDQDQYSPTHLEPLNMYIIVFREGTLSFHFRPTPHPQNVRRRIQQLKDYISVTSDWISYALIDDITDAFGPLIQSIEYEVDSIDELVLILKEAEQSDMLRRIGTCRKKVMGLLRLMGNKADVVKGLAKRCNENWRVAPTSDIGLYLSDIQDHLITMTQNLNHYEKILSRSHSNYLAQISIEMTDANNQINDVLSKLTALGTVLIPMNLVTGLWGMNVHVPGQDVDGYAWFVSIIACLAAFAIIGGYSTYKFMLRR